MKFKSCKDNFVHIVNYNTKRIFLNWALRACTILNYIRLLNVKVEDLLLFEYQGTVECQRLVLLLVPTVPYNLNFLKCLKYDSRLQKKKNWYDNKISPKGEIVWKPQQYICCTTCRVYSEDEIKRLEFMSFCINNQFITKFSPILLSLFTHIYITWHPLICVHMYLCVCLLFPVTHWS